MNRKTCLYTMQVAQDSPFEIQTFISQYPLVWQTAARLTAQELDVGENGPFENIQPWARLMEAAKYCRSCSLDKILSSQVSPCYRYKFDLRLNHPRLFGAHIFGIHRAESLPIGQYLGKQYLNTPSVSQDPDPMISVPYTPGFREH